MPFIGSKKSSIPSLQQEPQSSGQNVHLDWEQRDFTQSVQLGMTQLTDFLNEFGAPPCTDSTRTPRGPPARAFADSTLRGRIAQLNGKLGKLERQMQLIEATLSSVDQEETQ